MTVQNFRILNGRIGAWGSAKNKTHSQWAFGGFFDPVIPPVNLTASQTVPDFTPSETLDVVGALTASQTIPAFGKSETLGGVAGLTASQNIPAFGKTETLAAVVGLAVNQTVPAFGAAEYLLINTTPPPPPPPEDPPEMRTNVDAVLLPLGMEIQAVGGPMGSTSITTSTGGLEQRKSNWKRMPRAYKIGFGPEFVVPVLNLFNCQLAGRFGFMLHDPFDYKANTANLPIISATKRQLASIFQTTNYFTSAAVRTYVRVETLPNPSTLVVKKDGVTQTQGLDYTIGDQNGTLTFTTDVSANVISAQFEFFVGVRFADEAMNINYHTSQADGTVLASISQIGLIEVLPGSAT